MVYSWLPAIPYPALKESPWSPVTSTINFCEEDYYLTPYVAEVLNVTTNSIFLYLAVKGFRNALKEGHSNVFAVAFLGYSIIGLGSILFHSTLKYPMQLVDELAMIYTTLIMSFATFSYGTSPFASWLVLLGCVSSGVTITAVYHWIGNPIFHQTAFALIMIVLMGRSTYLMEKFVRKQSKETVTVMWKMISYGLAFFVGGFGLWNIDNIYCNELRRFRRKIGMPWGFFFELHALWHIGTGIGGYYLIVWGEYLRICLDGKEDEYTLVWPHYLTSFPRVDRKPTTPTKKNTKKNKKHAANGSTYTNGSAGLSNGVVVANGNGKVPNGKASKHKSRSSSKKGKGGKA